MWLLKRLNDGATKYLISETKSYTVGRKNCDFVLEDDASVSRKHCTIYVAKQSECPFPVNTVTGVWLVDEKSKYGTYLMNNNDWIKINPSENKKLASGSVVKFGLMGNIWSIEFKPVVACASGVPTEQKKNIESTLQSIDGFLRNSWCKECSLVIVNEITLTVKVVLALINGIPIVTPNYIQKLVESVKNQAPLPSFEEHRPVIKETILDKALVSLDTKNNRKELFKGIKFVIPTKKQLETLKEVIIAAGGSCELLSPAGKLERFAEDSIVVIQLPMNQTGIPENLCKLFKEISALLSSKFGKRIIPESEIAQAVAYSSTEKFCNPKSTCFNLKIGERKQVDLGPVIVEETPLTAEDSKQSQLGVVPSSETVGSELQLNTTIQETISSAKKTVESQKHGNDTQKPSSERKRTHSPNQSDHNFQKKKARSRTNDIDNQPTMNDQSSNASKKAEESSNAKQKNQNKPKITNYFQKQSNPPAEKAPQLVRQTSTSFWDFDSSSSKSSKRKISSESDDSVDNSNSTRKKPKLPESNVSKKSTPEIGIDTPREIVEVLNESRDSADTVPFPFIRKTEAEEDEDRTGYFGKEVLDNENLQMDELNNTIFSLTIISPAYINENGTLIDPPSVPVNVKRFRKQKILSSAVLNSLAEQDDELSDGEWIEPHSGGFNISVAEGSD